jgi:hypothetical protein
MLPHSALPKRPATWSSVTSAAPEILRPRNGKRDAATARENAAAPAGRRHWSTRLKLLPTT